MRGRELIFLDGSCPNATDRIDGPLLHWDQVCVWVGGSIVPYFCIKYYAKIEEEGHRSVSRCCEWLARRASRSAVVIICMHIVPSLPTVSAPQEGIYNNSAPKCHQKSSRTCLPSFCDGFPCCTLPGPQRTKSKTHDRMIQ